MDAVVALWGCGDGVGDFDPATGEGGGEVDEVQPVPGERIQVEDGVGDSRGRFEEEPVMAVGGGLCVQGEEAGGGGGVCAGEELRIVAHAVLVVVGIGVVGVSRVHGEGGFPVIGDTVVIGVEVGA